MNRAAAVIEKIIKYMTNPYTHAGKPNNEKSLVPQETTASEHPPSAKSSI